MKFLIVLAFVTVFVSCTSSKKENTVTPMQFSEKIVNAEMELAAPLAKAEQVIKTSADSSNFEAMGKAAEEAESLIVNKIEEIDKLPSSDFKGGDDFKKSALNYFEYIKSIYTTYKNIGQAKNEGVRLAQTRQMDTILSTQQNVITMMQAAQDKFALDNGFQVEKK